MKSLLACAIAMAVLPPIASDALAAEADQSRLLIVSGNSGRVVYDDGRDDLFCVTRRYVVGYAEDGRPIWRRTMHCR